GSNQAFTITPDACHDMADVLVDGTSVGAVTSYTFSNVTGNHTIAASFTVKTYTVTASAGTGGAISPSGTTSVNCGSTQSFIITPDSGYAIEDVLVDGSSVSALASYDFTNVTAAHTISASFASTATTVRATSPSGVVAPNTPSKIVPVTIVRTNTTPIF